MLRTPPHHQQTRYADLVLNQGFSKEYIDTLECIDQISPESESDGKLLSHLVVVILQKLSHVNSIVVEAGNKTKKVFYSFPGKYKPRDEVVGQPIAGQQQEHHDDDLEGDTTSTITTSAVRSASSLFKKAFPDTLFMQLVERIGGSGELGAAIFLHRLALMGLSKGIAVGIRALGSSIRDTITQADNKALNPMQTLAFQLYTGLTSTQLCKVNKYFCANLQSQVFSGIDKVKKIEDPFKATILQGDDYKYYSYTAEKDVKTRSGALRKETENKIAPISQLPPPKGSIQHDIQWLYTCPYDAFQCELNRGCRCGGTTRIPLGKHIGNLGKTFTFTINVDTGGDSIKVLGMAGICAESAQKDSTPLAVVISTDECYHIINGTFASNLNSGLKRLAESRVFCVTTLTRDYCVILPISANDLKWTRLPPTTKEGAASENVVEDDEKAEITGISYTVYNGSNTTAYFISEKEALPPRSTWEDKDGAFIPINIFACCDLAMTLLIQGRPGYSSSKCFKCDLKASEWKDSKNEGVDPQHHRQDQYRATTIGLDKSNLGFHHTRPNLLPAVPHTHWLCPPLHLLLGLSTVLYDHIIETVQIHIEDDSEEMIEYMALWQTTKTLLNELQESLDELQEEIGMAKRVAKRWNKTRCLLSDAKVHLDTLKTNRTKPTWQNTISELEATLQKMADDHQCSSYDQFTKRCKEQLDSEVVLKSELQKAKAKAATLLQTYEEKRDGKRQRPVQDSVQKVLNQRGISPQAFGSHSLTGEQAKALFEDGEDIMDEIYHILTSHPQKRVAGTTAEANAQSEIIGEFTTAMKAILEVGHYVFHYLSLPSVQYSDVDLDSIQIMIEAFCKAWRC